MSKAAKIRWKRVVFALVPLCVLVGGAEAAVRWAGLDRPSLQSVPLPEEQAGLLQPDPLLFWSLKPDTSVTWRGAAVSINAQGLRGPAIAAKQPGELRVLSLGESTTFGVSVSDDDTYSARLGRFLRERFAPRVVTVINAGVPAYSSFQSLTFLEQRGFGLEPDLVLFYHEVNDYLPTSLRDTSNNEVGVVLTDQQLFESRAERGRRALMRWSALYRWASYARAQAKIRAFDRDGVGNPLLGIGLPGYLLPPRLTKTAEAGERATPAHEEALGRRVSEDERWKNLVRLAELCRARGVELVIIHPSYRDSSRHECLLTRFAAEQRAAMFDAFDSLHPPGIDPREVFVDAWHPGGEGHEWLARDLAAFLSARGIDRGR